MMGRLRGRRGGPRAVMVAGSCQISTRPAPRGGGGPRLAISASTGGEWGATGRG